jgi:hypothetical protein
VRGCPGTDEDRVVKSARDRVSEEFVAWEAIDLRLIFPSPYMTPEAPMGDLRDLFDRVVIRAGFPKGRIQARMVRVTWGMGRGRCCVGVRPAWYTPPPVRGGRVPLQHFERRRIGVVTKAGEGVSAPLFRTIAVAPEAEAVEVHSDSNWGR